MTTQWNLADIFETVADSLPDKPAQIQGERTLTWQQFDARANALAANFLEAGLSHQAKVAAYLRNGPEYMETYLAAFKASLVPVNTNYRYGANEIKYLWDNADAEAVVFHASYTATIEQIKDDLPKVKHWCVVADGTALPDWAVLYEPIVEAGAGRVKMPWSRSGDDLLLLYTGGTTGMPKGVMWRQDDLFQSLGAGGNESVGIDPVASLAELGQRFALLPPEVTSPYIPACPMMHGTGQFGSFIAMFWGRTTICLENRKFSAAELWQLTDKYRVGMISIVGDAFARPMLDAIKQNPDAFDLSCVMLIASSGVMWSQEIKNSLLEYMPQTTLLDAFSSSEALGLGNAITTNTEDVQTADFIRGAMVKVITEDGKEIMPGEDAIGQVAVSGHLPLGYYKDEEKTKKTFPIIEEVRYSIPGDFAQVNADGSIRLLGRGSVCINTGGEKVFPEEVEETLKKQDSVIDAVCVGVPDERFGQAICAVVEPRDLANPPKLETLSDAIKEHLASYKVPRHLIIVNSIDRAPSGKVDYKRHAAQARSQLGLS